MRYETTRSGSDSDSPEGNDRDKDDRRLPGRVVVESITGRERYAAVPMPPERRAPLGAEVMFDRSHEQATQAKIEERTRLLFEALAAKKEIATAKLETGDDDEEEEPDEGSSKAGNRASQRPVPAVEPSTALEGSLKGGHAENSVSEVHSEQPPGSLWAQPGEELADLIEDSDFSSGESIPMSPTYAELEPAALEQPAHNEYLSPVTANTHSSPDSEASRSTTVPTSPTTTRSFSAPPPTIPPISRPPTPPGSLPPTPPSTPSFNQPPVPPLYPTFNTANTAPSPNSALAFNIAPQNPVYPSRRGVDPLARLGVVANYFSGRKTRRTLNSKIEANQRKSSATFAEFGASQGQLRQEQQRQTKELQATRLASEQALRIANEQTPLTTSNESVSRLGNLPPMPPIVGAKEKPVVAGAPGERQPASPDQLTVPPSEQHILEPKEHFERSSWHTIVTKNGKEVVGAIEYGDEFKKQRKEAISDDVGAGIGIATASAATPLPQASQQYYSQIGQPSGTSPVLPQGMSTQIDPQHQLPAHTRRSDVVPGPVFWVMLTVIVVAFFVAASI